MGHPLRTLTYSANETNWAFVDVECVERVNNQQVKRLMALAS
jgi:hypothetical protein